MTFEEMMRLDEPYIKALEQLFVPIAVGYDLDPLIVAGVLSRESGGGRLLKDSKGSRSMKPGQMFFKGTGDHGHGRGLMQVDDRYWHGVMDLGGDKREEDAWAWAPFNLAAGCWVLMDSFRMSHGVSPDMMIETALCVYNHGPASAVRSRKGQDPNVGTHNNDYGRDTVRRIEWLRDAR